jgi:hypothetical protein
MKPYYFGSPEELETMDPGLSNLTRSFGEEYREDGGDGGGFPAHEWWGRNFYNLAKQLPGATEYANYASIPDAIKPTRWATSPNKQHLHIAPHIISYSNHSEDFKSQVYITSDSINDMHQVPLFIRKVSHYLPSSQMFGSVFGAMAGQKGANGGGTVTFPKGIPHDLIKYFHKLSQEHSTARTSVRHPFGQPNPHHQPKMRLVREA